MYESDVGAKQRAKRASLLRVRLVRIVSDCHCKGKDPPIIARIGFNFF